VATAAALDLVHRLSRKIADRARRFRVLDAYYQGARRLQALGLSLPPEMEDLQVIINWPGMMVDSVEERLDIEGFRVGATDEIDETLWSWWRANRMQQESSLGNLEALIQGRAFGCVGFPASAGDAPVLTVESSRYMGVNLDPVTHRVQEALRLWDDTEYGVPQRATLYVPDANIHYRRAASGRGWEHDYTDDHQLGETLVVALINRERLADRDGLTEMRDIMGLADAACRSITNLQGAQELLSVPSRYVIGSDGAVDEHGDPVPPWEAYIGRYNTIREHEAKIVQLAGADLRNFTSVMEHYAHLAAGLTGLPAHYWGFPSDNPASADAIRSGESRLIKKAERKQVAFGDGWEQMMRLSMLVDGRDPADSVRLEAVWRDPATPTYAARSDAVVKQFQAELIPREGAWEDMGFSPERRRRFRSMMSDDPMERYAATMAALDRREQARTAPPAADALPPVPAGDGAP
jgi:hypothetical protein